MRCCRPHRFAILVIHEVLGFGWTTRERSGWLQKKGGQSRRNWKRRYFVLRGNRLLYFKKQVDADALALPKPKGAIPIYGIVAEEYDQHHSRPWIVSLAKADEEGEPIFNDESRVYYLDAGSESEQQQWISCIQSP